MANWEKLNKEFDDAITQFDKWALIVTGKQIGRAHV